MLRSLLLRANAAAASSPIRQSPWHFSISRTMAAKAPEKDIQAKGKKPHQKYDPKEKKTEETPAATAAFSSKEEAEVRRRQLAEDENNSALDVGPNGRPLFTSAASLSMLTEDDTNTYFKFSRNCNKKSYRKEQRRRILEFKKGVGSFNSSNIFCVTEEGFGFAPRLF